MALNIRSEAWRLPEDYPNAARRVFTSFRDHPDQQKQQIRELSDLITQGNEEISGPISIDLLDRMFRIITLDESGFPKNELSLEEFEVGQGLVELAKLIGGIFKRNRKEVGRLIQTFATYSASRRATRSAIIANTEKELPQRAVVDLSKVKGIKNLSTNCFLNSIFQAYLAQFPSILDSFAKNFPVDEDEPFRGFEPLLLSYENDPEFDLTILRDYLARNNIVEKIGQQDAMDALRGIWGLLGPQEMRSHITTVYPSTRYQYAPVNNSYYSSSENSLNIPTLEDSYPLIHIEPIKDQTTQQLIDRALNQVSNLPKRNFRRNNPSFYQPEFEEVQASKKTTRYYEETLPGVLTLAVDRFKTERSWVWGNQHVKIPDRIKLSEAISIPTVEGREYIYKLNSFIVHKGSLHRGHYIAYRKVDGIWYECDDNRVKRCDPHYALYKGSNAYIVFYEKAPIADRQKATLQEQLKELFLTSDFSKPRFQELYYALKPFKDLDSDIEHLLRYIKEVGVLQKKMLNNEISKDNIHYQRCMLPLMIRHFGKDKMTHEQSDQYTLLIADALEGIEEEEDSLLNLFLKELLEETSDYLNFSEVDTEESVSFEPASRDSGQSSSSLWGDEDQKHNG